MEGGEKETAYQKLPGLVFCATSKQLTPHDPLQNIMPSEAVRDRVLMQQFSQDGPMEHLATTFPWPICTQRVKVSTISSLSLSDGGAQPEKNRDSVHTDEKREMRIVNDHSHMT